MAVLADGGFGVAVDVEGVRHLRLAPHTQPDRRLCPGRRSGRGLGHADLNKNRFGCLLRVCVKQVSAAWCPHLFQAASCLVGQRVRARSSGREQGEAGANLPPRSAAVIRQLKGAAFMEI